MTDSNETIMYENVRQSGYEEGLSVNVEIFTPKQGKEVALYRYYCNSQ